MRWAHRTDYYLGNAKAEGPGHADASDGSVPPGFAHEIHNHGPFTFPATPVPMHRACRTWTSNACAPRADYDNVCLSVRDPERSGPRRPAFPLAQEMGPGIAL